MPWAAAASGPNSLAMGLSAAKAPVQLSQPLHRLGLTALLVSLSGSCSVYRAQLRLGLCHSHTPELVETLTMLPDLQLVPLLPALCASL